MRFQPEFLSEKIHDIEATFNVAEDFIRAVHQEKKEEFGIVESEKNKKEKQVCADSIQAFKIAMDNLHLKESQQWMSLDTEHIHILDPEEFVSVRDRMHGQAVPQVNGYSVLGECYLPRQEVSPQFIQLLTHEMAHTVQYNEGTVTHISDHEDQEAVEGRVLWLGNAGVKLVRSGLAEFDEGQVKYRGVMEAVTEMFARRVRNELVQIHSNLSPKEKSEIADSFQSYSGHIEVVARVMDIIGSQLHPEKKGFELFQVLWKDHITGSKIFLGLVHQYYPEAAMVLENMGVAQRDALTAANDLGFQDIIPALEELAKEQEEWLGREEN